jgi:ferric enterobactin receptor
MTRPFVNARALLVALTLLVAAGLAADAQVPGVPLRAIQAGPGEIRGRLSELGSPQPITSGSITVRRGTDSAFAGGALPKSDGSFQVDGLLPGRYTVRIRALGFAPIIRTAEITAANPSVDLGTIVISRVATQLAGESVIAERDEVELAPDRNSYSTKNMTTASGGTAVDVLRNVPSIEVDGTNNVSLRGNGNVVVQINGRSSPLKGEQLGNFLAQLPASAVKNIEVATNPSAKNDPEGTAGIINIVLNQEAELGLSGGFTASTGTTGQANASGNIGKQQGPLTILLSANVFRDSRTTSGTSLRTNLVAPVPAYVESRSAGSFAPRSGGVTLRSEYRLSKTDALSFDAFAFGGRFGGESASYFTDLDPSRTVIGLFDQFNNSASRNSSQDYTAAFRRTGAPRTPSFSTELRFSTNTNRSENELAGVVHQADASTGSAAFPRELDRSTGHFPSWNLQTDYSRPFGSGTKLETGFKGTDRHQENDFNASYFDSASTRFVLAPARTTAFDYAERIGAVYAVVSQAVQKVQLQGGLRIEQASTRLNLPTAGLAIDNRYASAFPSAIVSYNLTELRQAKVSYSRRISRPNPYQLSPIESRQDARFVFRGNPALSPEYTDAIELGLQEARSWGSLQLNPYFRRTSNAVRNIQSVDANGVTVSTFANVASATTVGGDLNVNYRTGPLTLFGGGSAFRYSSDASNLAGNLSARAIIWALRANATYRIDPLTDAQVFANYRAPSATEGGRQGAFVFMNAAVRRKMWGDQGSISLRIADPFNLMKFNNQIINSSVVEINERRFGQRGVFITVQRNFGQALKLRPRQDDPVQTTPPTPGTP